MKQRQIFFVLLSVFFALTASAHPADSIKLDLDSAGTILSIKVFHSSRDPGKHFIYKITITLNKEPIIQQTFKRQLDNAVQEAIYRIVDLKRKDKIEVTAVCNVAGKKSEVLIYDLPKE